MLIFFILFKILLDLIIKHVIKKNITKNITKNHIYYKFNLYLSFVIFKLFSAYISSFMKIIKLLHK